jgi:hypothetical protein
LGDVMQPLQRRLHPLVILKMATGGTCTPARAAGGSPGQTWRKKGGGPG